jgi:CopG family nickel-responsive transcriptional regulator
MAELIRMSLSLEKPLFDRLEKLVARSGYTNRSEYVRDMIRGQLVRQEWDSNAEVLGTITLVYDHHRRRLGEKLTDLQHEHHHAVLAATHVHLTHDLCAEVILVRDKARHVQTLADALRRQKGVLHADLSTASTGAALR